MESRICPVCGERRILVRHLQAIHGFTKREAYRASVTPREREKIKKLLKKGWSVRAISTEIGLSQGFLKSYCRENNLERKLTTLCLKGGKG